jgi:hypothetical protein
MKLNILMVQKQNLINLNWKPTQMVVEPKLKTILLLQYNSAFAVID